MKCPTCDKELGTEMKEHGECLLGNPDAIIDGIFHTIGDEDDPSSSLRPVDLVVRNLSSIGSRRKLEMLIT